MLLSIIIPSFQQASLLREALNSISKQDFTDYEILVMDGGSKDTTSSVIHEFSYLPLHYYSAPDKGIYDAMNKGIALSSGDFLYFMGCDDTLAAPDVLKKVFGFPHVLDNQVIYGDVVFTDSGRIYDGKFTSLKLLESNICHQAIFTRKDVFEALGGFDIRYKTYADWEFNMRWFSKHSIKRQYLPIVVANFNTVGFSSHLQDAVFFAEEKMLQKKYFSYLSRYLVSNLNRPLHYRFSRLLHKMGF